MQKSGKAVWVVVWDERGVIVWCGTGLANKRNEYTRSLV
jgi:hypothetical protein